ncbi:MAG: hypothetical protein WCP89_01160 [archaeon]
MTQKILYVDRAPNRLPLTPPENKRRMAVEGAVRVYKIETGLSAAGFDVDLQFNLSEEITRIIRQNQTKKSEERYLGLITHFPYDPQFYGSRESMNLSKRDYIMKSYGHSAQIIRDIRKAAPKLIMIAYSGATTENATDETHSEITNLMRESGFDDWVFKSGNIEKDSGDLAVITGALIRAAEHPKK